MTRYDLLDLRDESLTFYDGLNSSAKVIKQITGKPGSLNIRTSGSTLYVLFDK